MADLLVDELSEEVIARLEIIARRRGLALEDLARVLLIEAAQAQGK